MNTKLKSISIEFSQSAVGDDNTRISALVNTRFETGEFMGSSTFATVSNETIEKCSFDVVEELKKILSKRAIDEILEKTQNSIK